MKIKGIIFDVNGTLINIHTDEQYSKIYRFISRFLTFQGISVHHGALKEEYFQIIREQRKSSSEEHPEYDVQEVWREFLRRRAHPGCGLCPTKIEHMSVFLAELFRGSIDGTSVYPREVVRAALGNHSAAVIFFHNHPSGDPTPSEADCYVPH